jgi:glycosyltransferase involved in cell wall biosynthesis
METKPRKRVAVYSMFCLADQFDLAAEFRQMLIELAQHCDVMHLSMRGPREKPELPAEIEVQEYSLRVDRKFRRDIAVKAILQYFYLPVIARRLRKFKPDVIYLPDIIPMFPALVKLFTGCRVAMSYGDWHIHNKLEKKWWASPLIWFAEKMDRLEVGYVDCFTFRANAASQKIGEWGVPEERRRVFFDSPDMAAFNRHDETSLRKTCGFEKDDIVILYHGVMHQGKGIDHLIRWTAALYDEGLPVGLILVGAGPESAALKQLAEEVNFSARTHFTGWLETTKEVGNYCNAADICVAMRTGAESNVHIIPGALLHSMACGKVVIGPDLPGIREIIRDGDNGYMFKADDAEDFKRLIRELAAKRSDWPRVAGNAYQDILNNFTNEATARKYAAALEHFAELPDEKSG